MNADSKVAADHLRRSAYLYIRQSTLRQVLENTESTERQYALRRRAIALGWPEERSPSVAQLTDLDVGPGYAACLTLLAQGSTRVQVQNADDWLRA